MKQIQFITHCNERYSYVDGARMALEGGCQWIQLRMKGATDEEVAEVAAQIQPMCRAKEAIFIIDDRVELAKELKADGVHLGRNDMPVNKARAVLGEEFIIGATANTFDEIDLKYRLGADYIGCGPFRFTTTKENLAPTIGLDGYRHIMRLVSQNHIYLPVVAIGGIRSEDVADIMKTGVDGVAISSAILNAPDPVAEMKKFVFCPFKE